MKIEGVISVRRSTSAYVFYALWTAFITYRAWDSEPPEKYIWAVFLALSIAVLLRVITKTSYLELRDSKLTLNGDYFNTYTTEVSNIERIEIEAGPFGSSKIYLKGSTKTLKFRYQNVNNKDFKTLLHHLDVPVN